MVNSGQTVGQKLADSFLGITVLHFFQKSKKHDDVDSLKQPSKKCVFCFDYFIAPLGRLFKASVKLFDSFLANIAKLITIETMECSGVVVTTSYMCWKSAVQALAPLKVASIDNKLSKMISFHGNFLHSPICQL